MGNSLQHQAKALPPRPDQPDHLRTAINYAGHRRVTGWNSGLGAFTQAFDSDDLDASALMLPIVGFLPPHDPRVQSTVLAIATQLTDRNGLVRR
ncbi:hypothetical protein TNCT6_03260 [Streptomyces sp. 6-11-2]|nr:hypothetical protein TNCT6_03260 [Streptomyces sp. 6-11-2]